jgi:thiamine kinase-like enzyme
MDKNGQKWTTMDNNEQVASSTKITHKNMKKVHYEPKANKLPGQNYECKGVYSVAKQKRRRMQSKNKRNMGGSCFCNNNIAHDLRQAAASLSQGIVVTFMTSCHATQS